MAPCSAKCTSQARLDGKTAIVTGSNTGIGKESVLDFYRRGARVIMACRNVTKAEEAKQDIEKRTSGEANLGEIIIKELNLCSMQSVRAFAEAVLEDEVRINILLNNAGLMACPKGQTDDGFETQFGTNHLAHFLLTLLLLPKIIQSRPARIVTVSSIGHQWGKIDFEDPNYEKRQYKEYPAYFQSKLANVLFIRELAKNLKENGINDVTCYSLHPGAIQTELFKHMDTYLFPGMATMSDFIGKIFFKTPEQGAQTSIYCSVDEKCANESGLYYAECAVKQPAPAACDDETANKLWELSAKLVKLQDYDPFSKVSNHTTKM